MANRDSKMQIVCAYCGKSMGEKPGKGTSHGICEPCLQVELAKVEAAKKTKGAK